MEFNKNNVKTIIFIICTCIVFYLVLSHLATVASAISAIIGVFIPFIVGAGIAFVINVPMAKIEYWIFHRTEKFKKSRRALSVLITLFLVTAIVVLALYIIIPQIAAAMQTIANQLPASIAALETWIQTKESLITSLAGVSDKLSIDWSNIGDKIAAFLQKAASSMINSGITAVTGILKLLLNFLIGFIFAIYILMAKENLTRQGREVILALFREKISERILYICSLSNHIFARFISGQCLEACILGMMFFITMTIFGMPYAMLIAVVIAFSALIPVVGAFLGCLIGAVLILTVNPTQAFEFIIMFLILQQIEGNLIYPHVVGSSVGLPSIWVLMAVTIGANVGGVAGMIIFIPLCSVLYALFRTYVKERLFKKGLLETAEGQLDIEAEGVAPNKTAADDQSEA